MLQQTIQQPLFCHWCHHLAFQTLVPQAPQRIPVFWCSISKNNSLPFLIIKTFCTSRNIDSSTEYTRSQKHLKNLLLPQRSSHLVQIQLADRIDSPRNLDLGSPNFSKVCLERLHLQCCTHKHQ